MIGDKIKLRDEYVDLAKNVFSEIQRYIDNGIKTISIFGESGCGKSTLAVSLQHIMHDHGIEVAILHMDDYFILPPKTNHNARIEMFEHIGPSEVDLHLMDEHIAKFSQDAEYLHKPLVNYEANSISEEVMDISNIDILIVEGTYGGLLKNPDLSVMIDRNYMQTRQARIERNRDPIIPFNEKVLGLEHEMISSHKSLADIIVTADKEVIINEKSHSN